MHHENGAWLVTGVTGSVAMLEAVILGDGGPGHLEIVRILEG